MTNNSYTVYHNNRCSKSRCAIAHLEEKNAAFKVIEYMKDPLNAQEIEVLLTQLEIPASELIRKGEPEFTEHFKGKNLSEKEWIAAMVKFPKLIERPIIVKNGKAVIGRPTERIEEL